MTSSATTAGPAAPVMRVLGTTEGRRLRTIHTASTSDVDVVVPSFQLRLASVMGRLADDQENLTEFLNDLPAAASPDELEWIVEQWQDTLDLEEREPDLVVDLLSRLRRRS